MAIDWEALERALVDLSKADINKFAAKHGDETFYGFAFDCNSEYGQVLLCLNSQTQLRGMAVKYSSGDTPGQDAWAKIHREMNELLKKHGVSPSEKPRKTPEEEEVALRWSLGDWKYQGFNSPKFKKIWNPFEVAVSDLCTDEQEDENTFMTPTQDRFMRAACRAVIRLESEGAFAVLKRTKDFKTYVADHDELEEESWSRLQAVGQKLTSAGGKKAARRASRRKPDA